MTALLDKLPAREEATADRVLDAFLAWASERALELYPAQEQAILELFADKNVILATPTGSGKTLVAIALAAKAVAEGKRLFYTAPIKALVSEKFFELVALFGADNVGMATGDAAVNRDARVVVCTAEILSQLALREGDRADVDYAVMDELHFYSDRDRGAAWQIPMLALPQCQFLAMSATLGDTAFFERELEARTGKETVTVRTSDRPVPLRFEYRETALHETLFVALRDARAPVYVVCFTQREALEAAQAATSLDVAPREQKRAIGDAISRIRFASPFGKEMKRLLGHAVGLHHAGLLPKYRLAVEKLAQQGLLPVIFGTDTLGVGINLPIRTVLFTALTKYDGIKRRVLTVRDFQQLAGRAGRKGFDTEGFVVAQAPEHVIENERAATKAGDDPKKRRKLVHKKPPEGFVMWDRTTFDKLRNGTPEPLVSRFRPTHGMLLAVLSRESGGCDAMKRLIRESHDTAAVKRENAGTARALFHSLAVAGVVELVVREDAPHLRRVRVAGDLQEAFSLHHALSLFVMEAARRLDRESETYALDLLTLVESTLEDPDIVLRKQLDALKREKIGELKAAGLDYEDRMAELEKVKLEPPLEEFMREELGHFAEKHPWVIRDSLRPKSVARDLIEKLMSFGEYVREYELQRAEGVLLRYLGDAYKGMLQTVPDWAKTGPVEEIERVLRTVVRGTDASLLEEWERMRQGEVAPLATIEERERAAEVDITTDAAAFAILVRNEVFAVVRALARSRHADAAESVVARDGEPAWTPPRLEATMALYFADHARVRTDADARAPRAMRTEREGDVLHVTQTLFDDEGETPWALHFDVDLPRSREAGRPWLVLLRIAPA